MALPCGSTILWGINPLFSGLSPCKGQVAYALLTRAPVSYIAILPLDLHVLSLPLAFILSQDQTLRCIENFKKILFLLTSGYCAGSYSSDSFLFSVQIPVPNLSKRFSLLTFS